MKTLVAVFFNQNKGVEKMFCPKCGTRNDDNVRFCVNCGNPLSNQQQPNQYNQQQQQPGQFQQRPPLQQQGQFQQMPPLQQPGQYQQRPPLQNNQFAPMYQQPKKSKAGIIIAVIAVLVIIGIVFTIWMNGGFTMSNVKQAYISTSLDPTTSEPLNKVKSISSTEPTIYIAALIRNVDDGANIVAVWYHLDSAESVVTDPLYINYDAWVNFSIDRIGSNFPTGSYVVELYVDDYLEKTLEFSVY